MTLCCPASHPPVARATLLAGCLALALSLGCGGEGDPADAVDPNETAGWDAYGNDAGGQRHSPLHQITPDNVDDLEVAWTYHTGDIIKTGGYDAASHGGSPASTTFQNTPILKGDTLYLCSPFNKVIALDAETGEERWKYDPKVDLDGLYLLNCRGVSAWTDTRARPGAFCADRIFTGTIDGRLIALDAETGRPCPEFGDFGTVDLTEGIGEVQPGEYGVTSPPVILGDRVITGSMVLDNRRVDAPSGVVRAYSARTGRRLWAWNARVPGTETNEEGDYQRGTSNAWTALSADTERNLVFVPTATPLPTTSGDTETASTTTPVRSSPSTAIRAKSYGTTRPCTTTSGTTTSERNPCSSTSQPRAVRLPGSSRPRRWAISSFSIV